MTKILWFVLAVGLAGAVRAADVNEVTREPDARASEDAMFGGPPAAEKRTEKRAETRNDSDELKSNTNRDAFASGEVVDNALQMGGIFYQRMMVSGQEGTSVGNTPIVAPMQVDGFMDARPNDRLRGFLDARLLYDPTNGSGNFQTSTTSAAPSSLSTTTSTGASVVLDAAWIKFDVERAVFITVGKQHVKWGTARFWNPTDFLNPNRRDPLLQYDLRLGNYMAKFAIPWEAQKTNFYAIALLDNPAAANTLGKLGAALRAERVFGNGEFGVEAVFRGGRPPVYGADISLPLGPLDAYAEVAVLADNTAVYQVPDTVAAGTDLSTVLSTVNVAAPAFQASGGVNYSFAWKENRLSTIGVEYFYNQVGYDHPKAYPFLIFLGQFRPFYMGQHYAAVYLTAEGPDAEKRTSYTFSTLGNLSDMSFISRLDFSWRVLTYLTFEAYADAHYGTNGGEFRFSVSTPALSYGTTTIAPANISPGTFDVGIGLRMSL